MADEVIDDIRGKERYMGGGIMIIEAEQDYYHALTTVQEGIDVEFEVALGGRSTDNVCHPGPSHTVEASQGSKRV